MKQIIAELLSSRRIGWLLTAPLVCFLYPYVDWIEADNNLRHDAVQNAIAMVMVYGTAGFTSALLVNLYAIANHRVWSRLKMAFFIWIAIMFMVFMGIFGPSLFSLLHWMARDIVHLTDFFELGGLSKVAHLIVTTIAYVVPHELPAIFALYFADIAYERVIYRKRRRGAKATRSKADIQPESVSHTTP